MLKQDQITERIESKRKIKSWVGTRLDGLRSLDKRSREIGQLLLGCPDGKETDADRGKIWRMRTRAARQLHALDEPELLQLGEAMFPRFPDVFRAAWNLHERLPVQCGFMRKPFRTPDRADLLRLPRIEFLASLLGSLEGLDEDLTWVAAHAPHLVVYSGAEQIGVLLAAAIEMGDGRAAEIEQILRASAEGTHEIGQMGRHVPAAFLCSRKRECWEYVEKLLLAAQRQEGLRQVILESVDFAHPDAFRRMLRVIDEHNLARFSATVRAANVWLGLALDSQSPKYVDDTLKSVLSLMDDASARNRALSGNAADAAYFALWSMAFDDATKAVAPTRALFQHPLPEMRFAAVHAMGALCLPETYDLIVPMVDDEDVQVASFAAALAQAQLNHRMFERDMDTAAMKDDAIVMPTWLIEFRRNRGEPAENSGDLFERLERLFARLPKRPTAVKPLVWPWMDFKVARSDAADVMVMALDSRPRAAILPYIDAMTPKTRERVANLLGEDEGLDPQTRDTLLRLIGDASSAVREAAVKAMTKRKIGPEDLTHLEVFLSRKAGDLRRGVIGLILTLEDSQVLESAERLLSSKSEPQRLAGLDLLQQMQTANRAIERVRTAAETYRESQDKLVPGEQVYIDNLQAADRGTLTLDDALGLMDPSKRTPPTSPRPRAIELATKASRKLLELFDQAVHDRREEPIVLKGYGRDHEAQPLGSISFGFPNPFSWNNETGIWSKQPIEELPLREVWREIWSTRPAATRDADGLEAARAMLFCESSEKDQEDRTSNWQSELIQRLLGKQLPLRYPNLVGHVLYWMAAHESQDDVADFVVDGIETVLAAIPSEKLYVKTEWYGLAFRRLVEKFYVLTRHLQVIAKDRNQWTSEHARRYFSLMRWVDEPLHSDHQPTGMLGRVANSLRNLISTGENYETTDRIPRHRIDWHELVAAFEGGVANEHDVYDDLLGARESDNHNPRCSFQSLRIASTQLRTGQLSAPLSKIVRRAIDRVLEVELTRGELETVATPAALAIRYAGSLDELVRVLQAIGRDPKLKRTNSWGTAGHGKSSVFSHLVQMTMPAADDTPTRFTQAMKSAGISENTLLAVAFYAPQWARFVQHALGWELFAEAVWWFHAHTKDNQWRVEEAIRESWNAEIRKLTPLTLEELMEGAVDVTWFDRVYKALGEVRWNRMDKFAKYASGGAGHKRAQLFASAMLDRLDKADVMKEIETKRKQDAVRALGLMPLEKSSKQDVLDRYKRMQEFVRTSRQFGSQRQASEKLAARIGQENLARTAGFPDPIRLQWVMEGLATADLSRGPITVKSGDISVQLAIDSDGMPEISVRRGEKTLKSIPAEAKKSAAIKGLVERKTELRRSAGRMRQSLELAMCRGDRFTCLDLLELHENVILRPMLERLIFIGEETVGYPVDGGRGLRDHAAKVEPVKKSESLHLAHPTDLFATKSWTKWQHECFAAERVQPFKQVFRELYLLTEQEMSDGTFSRRYAGQQVNPRQAMALLGTRGWVTAPEVGVFRTFHDEKIVGWIEFMEPFFTPAEVEGLTLEKVRFARRGTDESMDLTDVPPRLLSETLRDVDLVVSVAHRGSVDPEASASTVELRASLLRESVQLLNLANVKISPPHVHIHGTRADYSVHLGSATTHMLPGGALFIVPVHSQHRGRLFLPFADGDPKTAEILSKVLLLSRDQEIKDPNILDQIRMSS